MRCSLLVLLSFLFGTMASSPLERFQSCQNEECVLIQCYFPIVEYLNATRNELTLFEEFFEGNHLFISYHLCTDLSAESVDELGACIYGVLFKLYQYDANRTAHQRLHVHPAVILEESISVVIDMICKLLYRIQSIDEKEQLKRIIDQVHDEDLVVINTHALTPRGHLAASKTILNYGQWFTFIYASRENECLYQIYSSNPGLCATENEISMKLERQWTTQPTEWKSVKSYHDLTHMNAFPRTLPTFFFIDQSSSAISFSAEKINIVSIDISTFPVAEIDNHPILKGPYPFVLFWSVKKNRLQRLGDHPSLELIERLLEEENESDLRNPHGMFDDEVRHLADRFEEIEINPKVIFLKTERDYHQHSPLAVLYTVKWDSTSKLARRTFHQIASRLTESIALIDIDCFDWTDICQEENIVEWPTLIVTGEGGTRKVYRGSTDEDEMALFLFRSTVHQPYEISTSANVTSIDHLLQRQRIVVLARLPSEEISLLETYRNLVDAFRKDEHLFFMFQFSDESPSLIVKENRGDLRTLFQSKTTVYSLNDGIDRLKAVITDALRPSWVRFDPIDLLQSTPSTFFAASRSQLEQLKNSLTSTIPSGLLPIVWIDTNSPWILMVDEYGEMAHPALIHLDFPHGYVYVTSTFDDIPTWWDAVQKQSIPSSYQLASAELNDRPSQKEIDFKEQMNNEQLLDEFRLIQETSQKINEHGIGFDSNGSPVPRQDHHL